MKSTVERYSEAIGLNVLRLRKQKGISRKALAKGAGLGVVAVYKLESGQPCLLTTLCRVADFFDVEPTALMNIVEAENSDERIFMRVLAHE